MSNVLQIVENEHTSEFYPTPQNLIEKMLQGVDWDYVNTILEPSAGKGDILRGIALRNNNGYYYSKDRFDVDCIEIDPNLRQILKYNFSDERKWSIRNRQREIEDSRIYNREAGRYEELPPKLKLEYENLDKEEHTFFEKGIHIVHDNFLTYNPYKQYDLIIMNPPFSNGDKHLLKAIDIQKKGGNIICLLNAETIRNPYTESRRELVKQLNKYGADIEYIDNAFVSAERKTSVSIALIKVNIPQINEESDIYNRLKEAEKVEDFLPNEVTDIAINDYIKAVITQFNIEVKAGLELIRQYRALKPYMKNSFSETKRDGYLLRLTDTYDRNYNDVSVNDYIKAVRLKYWNELLNNPKFTGKLTSKLQEEYREKVNKFADYDFSEFNIRTLSMEINSQIKTGIEDEIIKMFDRLTEEHSFYPECQKNRHYYNGWKTNKAHKIDKKVIIPCYGVFSSWAAQTRVYNAKKVLEDIEKILNYFDGGMSRDVDLWNSLENSFNQGITKNIELKYFKATFYKKGTVHLVFTCPELIDRFNIYAAQNKQWLPPCYGKKAYTNMTDEEKAVIDSFQGEKAYNDVMAKADYYLAPVINNQTLRLE